MFVSSSRDQKTQIEVGRSLKNRQANAHVGIVLSCTIRRIRLLRYPNTSAPSARFMQTLVKANPTDGATEWDGSLRPPTHAETRWHIDASVTSPNRRSTVELNLRGLR